MDSKKKIERAKYGPGMMEVIFGAVLSFGLGVVLSAALLVLKPLQGVKEMPKEPAKGVIYYIQGSTDSAKARQATAKRQAFLRGTEVSLTEEEINSILASTATPPPPPAPKAGAKADDKKKDEPAAAGFLRAASPNFKVKDGKMQIAVPCSLNIAGMQVSVTVLAVGGFEKGDAGFVFVPDEIHVGSLSANKLPALEGVVVSQVMASQKIPDDLAAAWKKASNVTVEGSTLKITM